MANAIQEAILSATYGEQSRISSTTGLEYNPWATKGTMFTSTRYADYSTWNPWEVDYLASIPELAEVYEAGGLDISMDNLFNMTEFVSTDLESKMLDYGYFDWTMYTNRAHLATDVLGLTTEDYEQYVADWQYEALAGNRELIEAGYPEYLLDPTPWDNTLTESDIATQAQLEVDYQAVVAAEEAAAAETAAAEALAAEEEAALLQQEEDLETINELAGYRSQSEQLAYEDIGSYVDKTIQYYKLRGVRAEFDEATVENLVTSRMEDYWSEENETLLSDLMGKYAGTDLELPELSNRQLYTNALLGSSSITKSLLG